MIEDVDPRGDDQLFEIMENLSEDGEEGKINKYIE